METIVVVRKYKYLKCKENKQTNKQKPVATSVNVKKKIITMLIFPNYTNCVHYWFNTKTLMPKFRITTTVISNSVS